MYITNLPSWHNEFDAIIILFDTVIKQQDIISFSFKDTEIEINKAKNEIIQRMINQAEKTNATAIINLNFEITFNATKQLYVVSGTGTAIKEKSR